MKVLFLCTGNSCRSQMAEGWARALHPTWEVASAGIVAHGLNPVAVAVMEEAGVSIAAQRSERIEDLRWEPEVVVTVCAHAEERCPVWPGAPRRLHRSFDDPPQLAKGLEPAAGRAIYRRVRDELRAFVEELPRLLELRDDR